MEPICAEDSNPLEMRFKVFPARAADVNMNVVQQLEAAIFHTVFPCNNAATRRDYCCRRPDCVMMYEWRRCSSAATAHNH